LQLIQEAQAAGEVNTAAGALTLARKAHRAWTEGNSTGK
jgi:hypothetical protein